MSEMLAVGEVGAALPVAAERLDQEYGRQQPLALQLRGETLDSVRMRLNRWYADHPDQLKRPVLETVWFELAVPGLAKSN